MYVRCLSNYKLIGQASPVNAGEKRDTLSKETASSFSLVQHEKEKSKKIIPYIFEFATRIESDFIPELNSLWIWILLNSIVSSKTVKNLSIIICICLKDIVIHIRTPLFSSSVLAN